MKVLQFNLALGKEKTAKALEELENETNTEFVSKLKCSHSYRYLKRENVWFCRNCGDKTAENPYFNGGGG